MRPPIVLNLIIQLLRTGRHDDEKQTAGTGVADDAARATNRAVFLDSGGGQRFGHSSISRAHRGYTDSGVKHCCLVLATYANKVPE
jgi:hypothetical protein